LFEYGNNAWKALSCVSASRFLFAYQQRTPAEMERNPHLKREIDRIIAWCENNTAASAGIRADQFASNSCAPTTNPPRINLSVPSKPPGSKTAIKCDIYSRVAAAQALANHANKCGNNGSRWGTDFKPHYQWCTRVSTKTARSETRKRQSRLDVCHGSSIDRLKRPKIQQAPRAKSDL
ncbi:MAG: hypothetical protein MJK04_01945, partial [Psychrosphaera sp.]|nr:hypothetical protein [Psychrosphaera sp.]